MNKINYVKEYVSKLLKDECTGHDIYHAYRVMENAKYIAKNEGGNEELIIISALVHDVIDHKLVDDVEKAKEELQTFLMECGYSVGFVDDVFAIITNISYSKGNVPNSLEGKIVQDADRLDALGAIGIARTFAYGGKKNRSIFKGDINDETSIAHFYDKLIKLVNLMNTNIGKQIAEKKTKVLREYLDCFHNEWNHLDLIENHE